VLTLFDKIVERWLFSVCSERIKIIGQQWCFSSVDEINAPHRSFTCGVKHKITVWIAYPILSYLNPHQRDMTSILSILFLLVALLPNNAHAHKPSGGGNNRHDKKWSGSNKQWKDRYSYGKSIKKHGGKSAKRGQPGSPIHPPTNRPPIFDRRPTVRPTYQKPTSWTYRPTPQIGFIPRPTPVRITQRRISQSKYSQKCNASHNSDFYLYHQVANSTTNT
jgi:hypothetical protein